MKKLLTLIILAMFSISLFAASQVGEDLGFDGKCQKIRSERSHKDVSSAEGESSKEATETVEI